jgi:hypothetical protein
MSRVPLQGHIEWEWTFDVDGHIKREQLISPATVEYDLDGPLIIDYEFRDDFEKWNGRMTLDCDAGTNTFTGIDQASSKSRKSEGVVSCTLRKQKLYWSLEEGSWCGTVDAGTDHAIPKKATWNATLAVQE